MLQALQELEMKESQNVRNDGNHKMMYYENVNEMIKQIKTQTITLADDIRSETDSCNEKLNHLQPVLLNLQEKCAAEKEAVTQELEKYKMKQFERSVQEKLCSELQEQLNQFQYEPKLCDSDRKILAESRKKAKLYYLTSRIRWDYSAPESEVKGYVTNTSKTEAEPFVFSADGSPICDMMWGIMERVVDTDWKDLEDTTVDSKND